MEEIFELIKAFNRLKDKVIELSAKIDLFLKSASQPQYTKYVDEESACKILHVCPRVLAQMRADKEIRFIKIRRKILFLASDLDEYLRSKSSG